uniref:Uncharacterized protein n=1 Tax=Crocodylus porosus TaxID=8502 RepID=A0A7M4E1G8_CROPO
MTPDIYYLLVGFQYSTPDRLRWLAERGQNNDYSRETTGEQSNLKGNCTVIVKQRPAKQYPSPTLFAKHWAKEEGLTTFPGYALMSRSSQFNQDKTTLIVTNNPLPDLTHSPQVDTPMKSTSSAFPSATSHPNSPMPSLPWFKNMTFLQSLQDTSPAYYRAARISVPHSRFSTDHDFKSEGQFSRNYAEKRMKQLYPHLHFHTLPGLGKNLTTKGSGCQWEPLTLSSLTETQSAVTAPSKDTN